MLPCRPRRRFAVLLFLAALFLPRAGVAGSTRGAPAPSEFTVARTLIDRGQYAKAESLASSIAVAAESSSPPDSLRAARALELIAEAMVMGGRFWHPRALEAAQRSVAIRERALGPDHPDVASSWFVVGLAVRTGTERLLGDRRRDSVAAAAFTRSLEIRRRTLGDDHLEVARSMHWLGLQQYDLFQDAAADSLIRRAAAIRERGLAPGHPDLAESMFGRAMMSTTQGRLDDSLYRRAIALTETALGPEHPILAERLVAYAIAIRSQFRFEEARQLIERALAIHERALGENLLTARTLNALGVNYVWAGDFERAVPVFERNLAMARSVVGRNHRDVAKVLLDLGDLVSRLGNEAEARAMLEESISIMEAVLPADDLLLALGLDMLGQHYAASGEAGRALAAYQRSLHIRRRRLPPGSGAIGESLSRLSTVTPGIENRYRLMEEAAEILINAAGPTSYRAARGLGLLAEVRNYRGDHAEALRLVLQSNNLWRQLRGPMSSDLGWGLYLLARIYEVTGHVRDATATFEQCAQVFEGVRGPDHTETAMARRWLSDHHLRMGRPREAFATAARADAIRREHLRRNVQAMSERQSFLLATSWNSLRGEGLNLLLQLACGPLSSDAEIREAAWDAVIRSRAIILDVLAARRGMLAVAADADARNHLERFEATVRRLSNLEVRGVPGDDPAQFLNRWQAAQRERDQAERDLAAHSGRWRTVQERSRFGFADLGSALPPRTALVAYARLEPYAYGLPPRDTLPARYVAFVLGAHSDHPELIALGGSGMVDSLVLGWQALVQRPASMHSEPEREREYRREAARLRAAIWDPIAARLAGADRVLVVPDGTLHLVNLATLPVGKSEYLVERAPIPHLLSAERDLALGVTIASWGRGLLAVGAPDFDAELGLRVADAETPPSADSDPVYRGPRSSCGEFRDIRFASLPAASQEVQSIGRLWRSHSQSWTDAATGADTIREEPAYVLIGARATETEFKRRAPGCRVLHLATHGFFVDGTCRHQPPGDRGIGGMVAADSVLKPPPANESPLLLAGLAMAGANHREDAPLNNDDGILTADEIAALDLSSVEWAVLSACETGLGTIRRQEGVVGLRRALRVAGARTTIMSLWAVDDEATRAWMTALYEARLVRGLGTAESVNQAQLKVLQDLRRTGASTHPFVWGGFVAVGDWR